MADFVAVLKKTLGGLGETTPEVRDKVYQKARATVGAKLAALNPPPPPAVAERQRKALEDAIRQIEAEYASAKTPAPDEDPLAELDALFAGLSKSKSAMPAPAATGSVSSAAIAAATKPEETAAGTKVLPTPVKGAELVPPEGVELPEMEEGSEAVDPLGGSSEPGHEPLPEPEELPPPPRRDRSGLAKWVAGAAAALVVFGFAGYAMWLNKDSLAGLFRGDEDVAEVQPVPDSETEETAGGEEAPATEVATVPAAEGPPEEALPDAEGESESAELEKYTQRLNPDGTEVDPGPAGGAATNGEGTSVAAATQSGQDATDDVLPDGQGEPAAAGDAALPVAQKAIFYEERTNVAQGSAEQGSVVWSVVEESSDGDTSPELAIRAEANVPDKDIRLRMTIRRNVDASLPASHIIELIFLTPENFAGGTIDNVLRMTMKQTEESAGNPLSGIPAKISDGFFLIALNDDAAAVETNRTLLRRQNWIDIPIVYKSGRRALITMEKGIPGEKVFEDALNAWQEGSSG